MSKSARENRRVSVKQEVQHIFFISHFWISVGFRAPKV